MGPLHNSVSVLSQDQMDDVSPIAPPLWFPAYAGMTVVRVYEPPASRLARRVPLLLTQKGEVAVASRFPGSSGWTLRPMGSRLRGNDEGAAGVTLLLQRSRERGNRSVVGRLLRER